MADHCEATILPTDEPIHRDLYSGPVTEAMLAAADTSR